MSALPTEPTLHKETEVFDLTGESGQNPVREDSRIEANHAQHGQGVRTGEPGMARGENQQRFDQMAKAAAQGLLAHRRVETAVVNISGTEPNLVLHLNCGIVPGHDASEVMKVVTDGIVPNVEMMLGVTFARHDLNFSLAEPAT